MFLEIIIKAEIDRYLETEGIGRSGNHLEKWNRRIRLDVTVWWSRFEAPASNCIVQAVSSISSFPIPTASQLVSVAAE